MNTVKRRFDGVDFNPDFIEYYIYNAPSKEMYGKELHGWGLSWRTKYKEDAEAVYEDLKAKGFFTRMVTVRKTVIDVKESEDE